MKQIAGAATHANTSHVPLATTPPATARHAVRHATRRAARRPRSRPRAGDVAEDLASAHRVPSCVKQCMAKSSAVHPMCRPRHPRRPRLMLVRIRLRRRRRDVLVCHRRRLAASRAPSLARHGAHSLHLRLNAARARLQSPASRELSSSPERTAARRRRHLLSVPTRGAAFSDCERRA